MNVLEDMGREIREGMNNLRRGITTLMDNLRRGITALMDNLRGQTLLRLEDLYCMFICMSAVSLANANNYGPMFNEKEYKLYLMFKTLAFMHLGRDQNMLSLAMLCLLWSWFPFPND